MHMECTKMFNSDYIAKGEIKKEHNPNLPKNSWPSIQNNNSWRFWSRKTNALPNLINHESDLDKDFLYAKDPNERKYQLLINKKESSGLKCLNDSRAFIEYSNEYQLPTLKIDFFQVLFWKFCW